MASNRSRNTAGKSSVATAQRPKPQPQNNQAIQPAPEVVVVDTPDFTMDAFDDADDYNPNAITALQDDPDDPNGLRAEDDPDDDTPVFSLNGTPEEVSPRFSDDNEHEFVGNADVEDGDEALAQARIVLAQAQEMMAQAKALLAQQQIPVPAQQSTGLSRRQQRQAIEQHDPIMVEAKERTRIIRTNADVGPVHYGSPGNGGIVIDLKKGVKYRVPEHVYIYCLERDLIWSMA